jgi:hypothetical protein
MTRRESLICGTFAFVMAFWFWMAIGGWLP